MGYSTDVKRDPASDSWILTVRVNLTRSESTDLFLSGDSMVSWPLEGMEVTGVDPRLERSSIFVSEVAAKASGLDIRYRGQGEAERAATLLRAQFAQIGIKEEN